MVYTLVNDSWRFVSNDVCVGPLAHVGRAFNSGMLSGTQIYWKAFPMSDYQVGCFDLCTEKWSELILPNLSEIGSLNCCRMTSLEYIVDRPPIMWDIGVFEGCLCLMMSSKWEEVTNVWVRKEDDCWVKLLGVLDSVVTKKLMNVPIVWSTDSREILLRKSCESALVRVV